MSHRRLFRSGGARPWFRAVFQAARIFQARYRERDPSSVEFKETRRSAALPTGADRRSALKRHRGLASWNCGVADGASLRLGRYQPTRHRRCAERPFEDNHFLAASPVKG